MVAEDGVQLDHDELLENLKEVRKRKHPSKLDLIVMMRIKAVIKGMREHIEGYYKHYAKLYGFYVLEPFLENQFKLFPPNYGSDIRKGKDEFLEYFHQLLTEDGQVAGVT